MGRPGIGLQTLAIGIGDVGDVVQRKGIDISLLSPSPTLKTNGEYKSTCGVMFYLHKLFNSIALVWMEFELGRLSAVGEVLQTYDHR